MEIDSFNITIESWIEELAKFSIDQLLIKPDNESWSLGQLYEHLIEESNWFNGQIEISLEDKDYSNEPTSTQAKILLSRGSFEDKRFKGDPLISDNVRQPKSVEQLKSELSKLKEDTNTIWNRMQSASNNGKSEHPGIGFLNCFEWLQYSEMHLRHHWKQKERIELFLESINRRTDF